MRILGIESSCDETAAAVVQYERGRFSVLSNVVASQVATHAKTGGVVPEVAARAHVEQIIPVIQKALHTLVDNSRELSTRNLYVNSIDAIAVTRGPGLITSLRVGVDTARILAHLWQKPLVAVNHLEGHIYASVLPSVSYSEAQPRNLTRMRAGSHAREILRFTQGDNQMVFPALALIVSGGHTELVLMRKHIDYKIIGATRDDAAGEAFDKVAKILGLGYPGGPAVSKCAEHGNPSAVAFPRPMISADNFDFSFAGLKTAVLYYVKQLPITSYQLPVTDICASFEQAVVDVLVAKTIRAAKKYRVETIILGGGVAANHRLRTQLTSAIKYQLPVTNYQLPALAYTGDNAAMIAAAGALHAAAKDFMPWDEIDVNPNVSL